jgi:hypothetical protein
MYKPLKKYLSFADYERDALLFHVFASSERQVLGNKTGIKKRR